MAIFFGSKVNNVHFNGSIKEVYYGSIRVWTQNIIKGTTTDGSLPTVNINSSPVTVVVDPDVTKGWKTAPIAEDIEILGSCIYNQQKVNSLDLTNADLSHMVNGNSLAQSCPALTTVKATNLDLSSMEHCSWAFNSCTALTNLDLSGWNTPVWWNMNGFFNNCSSLVNLDLSGWDLSHITSHNQPFNQCHSLRSVKVEGCNDTTVNFLLSELNEVWAGGYATWMKIGNYLKPTGVKGTTTDGSTPSIRFNQSAATVHVNGNNWCASPGTTTLTSLQYLCGGSDNLTKVNSVDVSLLDVSHVTNFQGAFRYTQITGTPTGLENWDTSSATSVMEMFSSNSTIVSLDLHTFNTSNVTDPRWLVTQNGSLQTINLSGWDLSKASATTNMFNGNHSLKSVAVAGCNSTTINKLINQLNTNSAGGRTTWHQSGEYLVP